jgi:DNA invertase Pin-like site-specific DNA recombinase
VARVSSRDQDPKSQIESARARGIPSANIHVEKASGARHDRPVLTKLLAKLQPGDVLMAFRLDRSAGRSRTWSRRLESRKIGFETLR